jgi:hypothetical protein
MMELTIIQEFLVENESDGGKKNHAWQKSTVSPIIGKNKVKFMILIKKVQCCTVQLDSLAKFHWVTIWTTKKEGWCPIFFNLSYSVNSYDL